MCSCYKVGRPQGQISGSRHYSEALEDRANLMFARPGIIGASSFNGPGFEVKKCFGSGFKDTRIRELVKFQVWLGHLFSGFSCSIFVARTTDISSKQHMYMYMPKQRLYPAACENDPPDEAPGVIFYNCLRSRSEGLGDLHEENLSAASLVEFCIYRSLQCLTRG